MRFGRIYLPHMISFAKKTTDPTKIWGRDQMLVKKNVYKFRSKRSKRAFLYEKTTWKNTQTFWIATSGCWERGGQRWLGESLLLASAETSKRDPGNTVQWSHRAFKIGMPTLWLMYWIKKMKNISLGSIWARKHGFCVKVVCGQKGERFRS